MPLTLLLILLVAAPLARLRPAGGAGRDPDGRRLQHGRLGGDPGTASADEDRRHGLDRHLRAHGVRRSDALPSASAWCCAALLFIKRVADTTTVTPVTDEYVREGHVHILQTKPIPRYVKIFRIHGPFLFGATDKLRPSSTTSTALPPIVILRLRNMTALDATGPARLRGARAGACATSGRYSDAVRRPPSAGAV